MAGYNDQRNPILNKIVVPVDWASARVLVPQISIIPISPSNPWYFNAECSHHAIDQVVKKKSGAPYERARAIEPVLLDKLLSAQDLTIDEAKRLAIALVTVEAEFTPSFVGLPVHVVVIEKPISGSKNK